MDIITFKKKLKKCLNDYIFIKKKMTDKINTFLDNVLNFKENHEEAINLNFPDDPMSEPNEWRNSIKRIISEDIQFGVDMRSTKILMCALNSQMNEIEFSKIINDNNLEDKFTYALICDFEESERKNIQNSITKNNGIFKSEVNITNDPEDNVLHCVFIDPVSCFKYIKSYYIDKSKNL